VKKCTPGKALLPGFDNNPKTKIPGKMPKSIVTARIF
jgi:hypothetical protein